MRTVENSLLDMHIHTPCGLLHVPSMQTVDHEAHSAIQDYILSRRVYKPGRHQFFFMQKCIGFQGNSFLGRHDFPECAGFGLDFLLHPSSISGQAHKQLWLHLQGEVIGHQISSTGMEFMVDLAGSSDLCPFLPACELKAIHSNGASECFPDISLIPDDVDQPHDPYEFIPSSPYLPSPQPQWSSCSHPSSPISEAAVAAAPPDVPAAAKSHADTGAPVQPSSSTCSPAAAAATTDAGVDPFLRPSSKSASPADSPARDPMKACEREATCAATCAATPPHSQYIQHPQGAASPTCTDAGASSDWQYSNPQHSHAAGPHIGSRNPDPIPSVPAGAAAWHRAQRSSADDPPECRRHDALSSPLAPPVTEAQHELQRARDPDNQPSGRKAQQGDAQLAHHCRPLWHVGSRAVKLPPASTSENHISSSSMQGRHDNDSDDADLLEDLSWINAKVDGPA